MYFIVTDTYTCTATNDENNTDNGNYTTVTALVAFMVIVMSLFAD